VHQETQLITERRKKPPVLLLLISAFNELLLKGKKTVDSVQLYTDKISTRWLSWMHARTFAKQPYGGNVEISQLGAGETSSATGERRREQCDDNVSICSIPVPNPVLSTQRAQNRGHMTSVKVGVFFSSQHS